jgi:DNA-binding MarR family transcriptional regulator
MMTMKGLSQMDMSSRASGLATPAAAEVLDLGALVGRLQRGLRRRARAALPDPALPQSQVEVIRLLHQEPGLRVQELATALGLAPNTASTLVQALVRQGLVERTIDPDDRRVARLELTEAARRRLARWRDVRAQVLGQALALLPEHDRAAIEGALPALTRLAALLEAPGHDR